MNRRLICLCVDSWGLSARAIRSPLIFRYRAEVRYPLQKSLWFQCRINVPQYNKHFCRASGDFTLHSHVILQVTLCVIKPREWAICGRSVHTYRATAVRTCSMRGSQSFSHAFKILNVHLHRNANHSCLAVFYLTQPCAP